MNQKIRYSMLLAICILISIGLFAQLATVKRVKDRPKLPAWVSDKGYWVVESNLYTPDHHTVFFYNNDNELMYRETLNGVRLNAEKRRIKMKLKKALETSAIAWEKSKNGLTNGSVNQSLVMTALR